MKIKKLAGIMLIAVLTAIILVSAFGNVNISPANTNILKDNNFSLFLNISTNESVYAVEGKILFNNSILKANSAFEGDFLKANANTFSIITINNSNGRIDFADTRLGLLGISGNGSLLRIDFTAIAKGNSTIVFNNSKILGLDGVNLFEIAGIGIENASVNVYENITNNPPVIVSYYPLNNISILRWQIQMFNITKHDADNDSLSVRWYLNNNDTGITNDFYDYNATILGLHNVSVIVSDNEFNVSREWLVNVYENTSNNPPTQPTNAVLIPTTAYKNTTFSCNASGSIDFDNDNITYYYEFRKQSVILQAYSLTNIFNCLTNMNCNINDIITCYAKAYDNKNYSNEKASNSVIILGNQTNITGNLTALLFFEMKNKNYSINYSSEKTSSSIDTGGYFSSIALDSNEKAHVSHIDLVNGNLRYCNNVNGWQCEILDNQSSESAIAIDSNNKVHIAYAGGETRNLKYCTNKDGNWNCSVIDGNAWSGYFPSIALDKNNKVHIAYVSGLLKYCNNINGWNCDYLRDNSNNYASKFASSSSIAIDSNNKAHISYYAYANWNDIGKANGSVGYCNNSAGNWICKDIIYGYIMGGISIALDKNNKVHIAYTNSSHFNETEWRLKDTGAGYCSNQMENWNCSIIDNSGEVGYFPSIAMDKNDKAHISYYDLFNNSLKYCNSANSWDCQILEDARNYAGYSQGRAIAIKKGLLVDNQFSEDIHFSWANENLMHIKISNNIEITKTKISLNENFSLFLNISTNASVYAVEGKILFNNSILKANSAFEGDFLKANANTFSIITINNSNGRIDFLITRYNTQAGISGDGYVLVINFTAIAKGNSSLEMRDIILSDNNTNEIGTEIQSTLIEVASNSPPIVTNYFPSNATMYENTSLIFNITKSDADNDFLFVRWYFDGKNVLNNSDAYNYYADFNASGMHNVSVIVSDSEFAVSKEFNLFVINVNRKPIIDFFSPQNLTLKIRNNQQLLFNHSSYDDDNDLLTYSWKLNNTVTSANKFYLYNSTACGNYSIRLEVSDSLAITNKNWSIIVNLKGDVNLDRKVNIFDFVAVGLTYGSNNNSINWNKNADVSPLPGINGEIEGDNKIDIADLALVGSSYGKVC